MAQEDWNSTSAARKRKRMTDSVFDESMLPTERKREPSLLKDQQQFLTQKDQNTSTEDSRGNAVTSKKERKKPIIKKTLSQAGYIGQIEFLSADGRKREFRLFQDSSLGLGPGTQSVLIEQEWDEDIETDSNCERNAVKKCIKQLNSAIRHQQTGIDPTKQYTPEYTSVQDRFYQENLMINRDKYFEKGDQEEESSNNSNGGSVSLSEYLVSQSGQGDKIKESVMSKQIEEEIRFSIKLSEEKDKQSENNQNKEQEDPQAGIEGFENLSLNSNQLNPYYFERLSSNDQYSQYRFIPDFTTTAFSQNL